MKITMNDDSSVRKEFNLETPKTSKNICIFSHLMLC